MEQSNVLGTTALVSLKEADSANQGYKKAILRKKKENDSPDGSGNAVVNAITLGSGGDSGQKTSISSEAGKATASTSTVLGSFFF